MDLSPVSSGFAQGILSGNRGNDDTHPGFSRSDLLGCGSPKNTSFGLLTILCNSVCVPMRLSRHTVNSDCTTQASCLATTCLLPGAVQTEHEGLLTEERTLQRLNVSSQVAKDTDFILPNKGRGLVPFHFATPLAPWPVPGTQW